MNYALLPKTKIGKSLFSTFMISIMIPFDLQQIIVAQIPSTLQLTQRQQKTFESRNNCCVYKQPTAKRHAPPGNVLKADTLRSLLRHSWVENCHQKAVFIFTFSSWQDGGYNECDLGPQSLEQDYKRVSSNRKRGLHAHPVLQCTNLEE